jgi:hypothetical protein
MLVNINYFGKFNSSVNHLPFNSWKPRQYVEKNSSYTLIVFPNGKCRFMGCKEPLLCSPMKEVEILGIASITVVVKLSDIVNLQKLSRILENDCMYEPELFPALRYIKYNPMCVNIFASGKVVILGLKTMEYNEFVNNVLNELEDYIMFC